MSRGYVYVLVNPAMPGLAKVGKTTRVPSERVAELSSATGVPSPFILLYEQPVDDCNVAEAWVHERLAVIGRRPTKNREFFDAPLHVIVKTVAEAALACAQIIKVHAADPLDQMDAQALAEGLYNEALRVEQGDEINLPDRETASRLVEEAARLGNRLAQKRLLDSCMQRGNWQRGLEVCRELIEAGEWWIELSRASIFDRSGHRRLANERRGAFFQAACEHLVEVQLDPELTRTLVSQFSTYIGAVATKISEPYVPHENCLKMAPLVLAEIDSQIKELKRLVTGTSPGGNARMELFSAMQRKTKFVETLNRVCLV